MGKCLGESVTHMLESHLAITTQSCNPCVIKHQGPDRRRMVICDQRMKVREGKSAPGSPQHGEPICAVGSMKHCPGQASQILDDLALGQSFYLNRLKTDPWLMQSKF